MHVKKGDTVKVTTGKDKGKSGKIVKAYPKENKVLIEGVNLKKVSQKGRGDKKGSIIEKIFPIDASNVKLIEKNLK